VLLSFVKVSMRGLGLLVVLCLLRSILGTEAPMCVEGHVIASLSEPSSESNPSAS